jgi:LacI family kdg operon repressor
LTSDKRVTIRDVAQRAGVSITTVSRYLNQNYGSMSEATKERIAQVIEELGYRPNKLAQGLRGLSRTVAVLVVNMGYPFCVSVIRSLSNALHSAGFSLMVYETGGDAEREKALLESLISHQVSGLVIQTNGANNDVLAKLARQIPVVIVDRRFHVPGAINVITNNVEASESLVDALFQKGYHKVLYVTEALENISTRVERLQGYEAACRRHGSEPWVAWVRRNDKDSMRAAAHMLESSFEGHPIAVYTANGLVMLELYPYIKSLRLRVPEELGIATFDEPDWVKITSPQLTCVRQPTEEMGECAAQAILAQLQDDNKPAKRRSSVKVIESTVILDASTAL